jgi:hypothetical protein
MNDPVPREGSGRYQILRWVGEGISSPREWLLIVAMVGAVFLALQALDAFPSLERDPVSAYGVTGTILVVAFAFLAHWRHRLMPWGTRAPGLMWGGLVALAAVIAFASWGLVSYANGALDHASPNFVRFAVVDRTKYHNDFLLQVKPEVKSTLHFRNTLSLDVTPDEWESTDSGSSLLIDLRPGFFHLPWVAGYRLCVPTTPCTASP